MTIASMSKNCSEDRKFKINRLEEGNRWEVSFDGPKDTPYEGRVLEIDVKFPGEYPFKAPRIQFLTPVYHPNVKFGGVVSPEALGENEWKPNLRFVNMLNRLLDLLAKPDLSHVMN